MWNLYLRELNHQTDGFIFIVVRRKIKVGDKIQMENINV